MIKAKIYNLQGAELKSINLPIQFSEEVNPDLIKRAVLVVQNNKRQRYGAFEEAGKRQATKLSKRRRNYKTSYGHAISRVGRKIMWRRGRQFGWTGAFAPGTVGGRRAHPPTSEKDLSLKINKRERRKAIRSAIAATMSKDYVSVRHEVPKEYPLIIESKIESLNKTKEIKNILLKFGLEKELERVSKKTIRAGKGKARNRKYQIKKGPLFIVSKLCSLEKAARNLQGFDFIEVDKLNAELLAPGAIPGRLVIWSEGAIERLEKEKLFTNDVIYIEKEKQDGSV